MISAIHKALRHSPFHLKTAGGQSVKGVHFQTYSSSTGQDVGRICRTQRCERYIMAYNFAMWKCMHVSLIVCVCVWWLGWGLGGRMHVWVKVAEQNHMGAPKYTIFSSANWKKVHSGGELQRQDIITEGWSHSYGINTAWNEVSPVSRWWERS